MAKRGTFENIGKALHSIWGVHSLSFNNFLFLFQFLRVFKYALQKIQI